MTTQLVPLASSAIDVPPTREEAERTATMMAREYQEATAEIARLMLAIEQQTLRLREAFRGKDPYSHDFRIDFEYAGERHIRSDRPDHIFKHMKRHCWEILINHLGIKNVMSVAKRQQFEQQLNNGDLPEISPEAILGILGGLASQAQDFAQEAAREVWEILRPQRGDYKTNDKYRVGRRVILAYFVERCWDGKKFRINYHHEQRVTAIDGVFHLLDGRGIMREQRGPLCQEIEASPDGRGETDYFRFRCFKNCNLHLEFKRLDLVMDLNLHAVGEKVLGLDEDAS